jgi:hypothetical protein
MSSHLVSSFIMAFPYGFPTKVLYAFTFPHICYMPYSSYILLDLINYTPFK